MVTSTKTKVERNGEMVVMRFEGDITSASEDAVLGKYRSLDTGTKIILLDFSKVLYLNSERNRTGDPVIDGRQQGSAESGLFRFVGSFHQGLHHAGAREIYHSPFG